MKRPADGPLAAPEATSEIAIAPVIPDDLPGGGAGRATLAQAAIFAWQEFIALNWPASRPGRRGVAERSARFGDRGPVVWETYRHKTEVFPGFGIPDRDDNAGPAYLYNPEWVGSYPKLDRPPGSVPSCSGTESTATPFINLDETNEIDFDHIYTQVPVASAGDLRLSAAQRMQILFLAKVNDVNFKYVQKHNWFLSNVPPFAQTAAELTKHHHSAPPDGPNPNLVSFPSGTIELKAAWRRITRTEAASGRFYTAPVRFYRAQTQGGSYGGGNHNGSVWQSCYVDEPAGNWGLVGLHIIHKTPTAPYFTYATFEQADNILDGNGQPREDAAGASVGHGGLPEPERGPFTPDITSHNATAAAMVNPSSVQKLFKDSAVALLPYGLEYQETDWTSQPGGTIHINDRENPIPPTIIQVNREVQRAIRRYNPSAPWQYYKLINIQYRPVDKPRPGADYEGDDRATYYLANIVAESDYNLQMFSGAFQVGTQNDGTAVISPSDPREPPVDISNLISDFTMRGQPFKNVQYNGEGYTMGGCMGCHGNAQALGADFSFLLHKGAVDQPGQIVDDDASSSSPSSAIHVSQPRPVCDPACKIPIHARHGSWLGNDAAGTARAASAASIRVCHCEAMSRSIVP